MLPAFIDHLWQSIVFAMIVCGLALLARRNSAAMRLWLWRIAALKFLLPFSLLFALGGWLGFPVRHSAVPPPAALTELVAKSLSITAPATTFELPPPWTAVVLVLTVAGTALCLAGILRELRSTKANRHAEEARISRGWNDRSAPPGFLQSALLAAVAVCSVSLPVVAGAVRDRQWRQQILAVDQRALRSASISMSEAPPGIGILSRVAADNQGVLIRNINIQDLVALVYGIGKFEVFGGALPWLEHPRYDVRISGPLRAPEFFDPYSVRQPMTDYLYLRFGVSIRVNGSCQKPCKDHQSFVIERLPNCASPLSSHPCRQ